MARPPRKSRRRIDPVSEARELQEQGRATDAEGPVAGLSPEALVERYRAFCESIVRNLMRLYHLNQRHHEDMISDALEGLLTAHQRYDPAHRAAFSTFAHYRIKGSVIDGLRRRMIVHRERDKAKLKLQQAATQCAEAQPPPSHDATRRERLAYVDRSISQVSAAYQIINTLEAAREEQRRRRSPQQRAIRKETAQRVRDACDALPEAEREIVRLIHFEELTQTQAAEQLGLSKSWTSRLYARAMKHMRQLLHDKDTTT